jgi:hypothetical protein
MTKKKKGSRKTNKKVVSVTTQSAPPWSNFYVLKGEYIMNHPQKGFIRYLTKTDAKEHLKVDFGVSNKLHPDALCKIRNEQSVVLAGGVAGYPLGIHIDRDTGKKFLVTDPPNIIEAVSGTKKDWPTIRRILIGTLLDRNNKDQFFAVMGWWRQARENVKICIRRPLPALALVGPPQVGKTLLLDILRQVLGGRSTPAYKALTKSNNNFNAELLHSELLVMDDDVAGKGNLARMTITQSIKSLFYSNSIPIEFKSKDATQASPVQFLAIAVNEEPAHLRVLPELDGSMNGKITLIKVGNAPLTASETRDRAAFQKIITAELPFFLHWLETKIRIPDRLMSDPRSVNLAFHHPEVLAALQGISPEIEFLDLVHHVLSESFMESRQDKAVWQGTSVRLHQLLTDLNSHKSLATKILWSSQTCGDYLARLAKAGKYGVRKLGQGTGLTKGKTIWEIEIPRKVEEGPNTPKGEMWPQETLFGLSEDIEPF